MLRDDSRNPPALAVGRFKHKDILARWVIEQGLSTGHGDTFCSILDELKVQLHGIRLENNRLKEKLYETQSEVVLLRNKTPNAEVRGCATDAPTKE